MASLRAAPAAGQTAEENGAAMANSLKAAAAGAGAKAGALSAAAAQGAKRRALGDLSNNLGVPGPVPRPGGKDGKAAAAGPQAPVTRARAKQGDSAVPGAKDAAAPTAGGSAAPRPAQLVARTRAQQAALQTAPRQSGVSMSSLLQTRSEAAVTATKAPPPSPLPDIDSGDKLNPLMASEYVNDIYAYYKRVEPRFRVPADYMTRQADINDKMRSILIDWLVEVHLKFKLMPETLFLTVNLIDRFLAEKQVTRKNLQLVGVTAMLISSKYEEIWAPEVRDFVYISDRAYTKEQILGMEKVMLNTLRFQLTLPTVYNFLARDLKAANMHFDKDVTMLASYVVELAQVDPGMLRHSYSLVAVASLHVAMASYGKADAYPKALAKHSGYSLEEVRPIAAALVELMAKAPTNSLNAVYKKYSSQKYNEAAKRPPPAPLAEPAAA